MFDRAYFPTKVLAGILAIAALGVKATSQSYRGPTSSADHGAVMDIERGLIGSAENVAPVVFNPVRSLNTGHDAPLSVNHALTIDSGSLRRRSARLNDDLVKIYALPEYDEAYRNAEKVYQDSAPKIKRDPIPWHSYKQSEWFRASEKDLLDWTNDAMTLSKRLHALQDSPDIQNDPAKLAVVRQIEDAFTKAALDKLNAMVASEGLVYQFTKNNMLQYAAIWTPEKVPVSRNTADIDVIGDFVPRLNADMAATWQMQVHFATTAKFAGYYDIPRDEDDKPLKNAAYKVYWRTDTARPVQETLVDLHSYLDQANTALKASGLLTDDLRQAIDRPAPASNATSLALGNSIH